MVNIIKETFDNFEKRKQDEIIRRIIKQNEKKWNYEVVKFFESVLEWKEYKSWQKKDKTIS